jgi:hypothetical protein
MMRTCRNQRAGNSTLRRRCLTLIAVVFVALLTKAQDSVKPSEQEQFGFGREQVGFVPIRQPIAIPQSALDVMSKDDIIAQCVKSKNSDFRQLPTQWFVAAAIHLHSSAETDLVIMPRMLSVEQDVKKSESGCWDGIKNGPFWILRKVRGGFIVVLSESADGLEIRPTRSRGVRDIWLSWITFDATGVMPMKFDGKRYVVAKNASVIPKRSG